MIRITRTKPTEPLAKRRKRDLVMMATSCLLLFLAAVFYVTARYKQREFGDTQLDEIIFYFMNGLSNGQSTTFVEAIRDNTLLTLSIALLLMLPIINFYRNKYQFNIRFKKSKRVLHFNPSAIPSWTKLTYAIIVSGIALWYLLSAFGAGDYIRALNQSSTLFEDNYVDASQAKLKFPETKRNLVYIYLESMENTIASTAGGGRAEKSIIPELEQLALDPRNTSFSHLSAGQGLGGPQPVHGTTWTVSGITAQTAGVPLKVSSLVKDHNSMGEFNEFLPGATMLGDILRKQGYNQTFIMGSPAKFGGRDKLLKQHGDYHIIDLPYARQNGLIPSDYKVWWGFEDRKTFSFAKAEATRLAEQNKPFNLQLLTADTHFSDGYLDPACPTPYSAQYDNVYACSSAQVADFVAWLRAQPFGANTTIVITGDHLGMQSSYYESFIGQADYTRSIYNVIINSAVAAKNPYDRLLTSFDMYPTTLAAMGIEISGDRLALGTNLFSDEQTLPEKYGGIAAFNDLLTQRSQLYERHIRISPR